MIQSRTFYTEHEYGNILKKILKSNKCNYETVYNNKKYGQIIVVKNVNNKIDDFLRSTQRNLSYFLNRRFK